MSGHPMIGRLTLLAERRLAQAQDALAASDRRRRDAAARHVAARAAMERLAEEREAEERRLYDAALADRMDGRAIDRLGDGLSALASGERRMELLRSHAAASERSAEEEREQALQTAAQRLRTATKWRALNQRRQRAALIRTESAAELEAEDMVQGRPR